MYLPHLPVFLAVTAALLLAARALSPACTAKEQVFECHGLWARARHAQEVHHAALERVRLLRREQPALSSAQRAHGAGLDGRWVANVLSVVHDYAAPHLGVKRRGHAFAGHTGAAWA